MIHENYIILIQQLACYTIDYIKKKSKTKKKKKLRD